MDPKGCCIAVKRFSQRHGLVAKFDLFYRARCNGYAYTGSGRIPEKILVIFNVDCVQAIENTPGRFDQIHRAVSSSRTNNGKRTSMDILLYHYSIRRLSRSSYRTRRLAAIRPYSPIMRSAHSTRETKTAGLPNFALQMARSFSETPRAREHAPQENTGMCLATIFSRNSLSGGQPIGSTASDVAFRIRYVASAVRNI